jgi:outer membrane protein assembly factor BamE (lipoprotein component of BamABCDE complex)
MNPSRTILACVLILLCGGCVVPLPSKVSAGHQYSRDALAFLDLPDTTREDVVASLGPPLIESRDARVLFYTSETTGRTLFIPPQGIGEVHWEANSKIEHGSPQEWGLFIAYEEHSLVSAHEILKIGTDEMEQRCVDWQHTLAARRKAPPAEDSPPAH